MTSHPPERRISDEEALNRIALVFDDAEQSIGDVVEEVARFVRLSGRALTHDHENEEA